MARSVTRIAGHLTAFCAAAALVVGCGGPKPKPVAKPKTQQKPKVELVNGVPRPAHDAFVKGVEALEKKPPAYTDAVSSFETATKAHPKYVVGWLNLAYSYERLGRYTEAVGAYRKLVEQNVIDRGVTLALGRVLLLSGQPDQAIVEFESVLRKQPEDLEARNNLAAAYLAKGDVETSLRYVKEVLAVQPKNVPAIINLGLLYLEQKKLPLALLMFNKALGYDENNARARSNLGLTFYKMELVPAAVLAFEKAIALDPTIDEARLNLASIYLDYLDYDEALKQFKAVRERFPKNYRAVVGEANSLYGIGEYEAAAKLYEQSLEIDEKNPEALIRVGKIYEEQLGDTKKALGYYIRYRDELKLPPDHPLSATIQFLQQADTMETKTVGDDGTGEGGEGAPVDGEGAPVDGGEATPVDGEAAPADGEAAPADGEAAPADGEAAPADGEAAPADGEAAPAEGDAAAAEGEEKKPEGGEAAPADGKKKPEAGGDAEPAADEAAAAEPAADDS